MLRRAKSLSLAGSSVGARGVAWHRTLTVLSSFWLKELRSVGTAVVQRDDFRGGVLAVATARLQLNHPIEGPVFVPSARGFSSGLPAVCPTQNRQSALESIAASDGRWLRSCGAPAGFALRSVPKRSSSREHSSGTESADRVGATPVVVSIARRNTARSFAPELGRPSPVSAMPRG